MLNDVRYAVRSFLKTPGLTAVILITLALGIGTNTAIFSVVYGVLLRPLPYPRPDDLVQVWNTSRDESRGALAAADFLDLQHANRSLARLAGYREDAYTVAVTGREPVRISGALCQPRRDYQLYTFSNVPPMSFALSPSDNRVVSRNGATPCS